MKKFLIQLKPISFLIIGLFIFSNSIVAQDIFDQQHSKKFANHLFISGEFQLAAVEYERVIFQDPDNEKVKINLLKSYRYSHQYQKGISRANELYPLISMLPDDAFLEYGRLLLSNHLFEDTDNLIKYSKKKSPEHITLLSAASNMYQAKWENAQLNINNLPENNFYKIPFNVILNEAMDIKYKSPALSGVLSAAVPGLGKVYTGYWKDGLVSFITTGISAWQAYRGFNMDGAKSPYGWIYSALTVGFYIGNIYGSVKSANKYNYRKNHLIQHKIEEVFINN